VIGFTTQNAGASRIYGLETDTEYLLTHLDRLRLTANYTNARFTQYEGQYGTLSGIPYPADLSGNTPPLAPEVVLSLGYDHTFNLANSASIVADGVVRYTSHYFLTVNNWAGDRVDAYWRTDLGLEYRSPNKSVSVRAYVHNLENKVIATYASYINPPGEYVYDLGEPRTFGAQVTKSF
jgi:iron complex outermembrane receptor protein